MEVDRFAADPPSLEKSPVPPRRALLVDDALANSRWLSEILRPLGFDSTFASNIGEARNALSHLPFDIVFLDCDLPDGFGYSLAEEICQMRIAPMPAIIGMTASDDSDLVLRYVSAGAKGFMLKPMSVDSVHDNLRRCGLLSPEALLKNPESKKIRFQNVHFMAGDDSDRFQFYLRQIDEQLETEVTALAAACKKGEPGSTRRIVHRLLSLTPLIESREFTDLLQGCQRAARSWDVNLLQKLGKAVELEYCVVRAEVRNALVPHPPAQDADASLRKSA